LFPTINVPLFTAPSRSIHNQKWVTFKWSLDSALPDGCGFYLSFPSETNVVLFVALGVELKDLHLPSTPTTWTILPVLLLLVGFSNNFVWTGLDPWSSYTTSWVRRIIGINHQPWLWDKFLKQLPTFDLLPYFPLCLNSPLLPRSWVCLATSQI
jgi:hypothetical protein